MLGLVLAAGAMLLEPGWLRLSTAFALGTFGLLVTLVWALRANTTTAVGGILVPLGYGAAAAALLVPQQLPDAPTLTPAIAAFAAAVLAAIVGVIARELRPRAAAWAAAVVLVCIAGLALLSPLLEWSLPQFAMVLSAASVVAIRALPTLTLSVDDGYHVDYQRFMVLRWTVRGRMPEYVARIDSEQARQLVAAAEARLATAMPLLALTAIPGIPVMLTVAGTGNVLERISAGFAFVLCLLGLMLLSRRTASPGLRMAPRLAVMAALVLSAIVASSVFDSESTLTLFAGGLLLAGLVAAAIVLPVAAGSRSLSWSRTGDIVESIAIALVVPAALLAAATMDTLRGVLVA